jgi:hypothetical protein
MGNLHISLRARPVWLVMALAFSSVACADAPDPEETARKRCIALRDHLIDLRLTTAEQSVDVDAHRKAFENALGERFLDDCLALPAQQIDCSLRAADSDAVSSCVPSPQ